MGLRRTVLLLVALLTVLGGCDDVISSQLPGPAGESEIRSLEPVPLRKTTSEHIALRNLDAAIEEARKRLAYRLDLATASELVDRLLLRADLYGSYDDWDEARRLSRVVLDAYPESAEACLLRANVLSTLHDFDAALQLLEQARTLHLNGDVGSITSAVHHMEATIERAIGSVSDNGAARQRRLAIAFPTYQHATGLALTLAELGRFVEADDAFRSALERYRDVSPFPFAWVAFQRGVMWSEKAGRPDLGEGLYREALRYLPGHVLANVHLAEIEASRGEVEAAVGRLEPLMGATQNPEPVALLARLASSAEDAHRYQALADAAYRGLLRRFPSAFLHHAPSGL